MSRTDVLIVGAGPTGLCLALFLARLGVHPRIVDVAKEPGTTSRALAVQARTLELYGMMDLADEVVRRGLTLGGVNLWRRGERAGRLDLSSIGEGRSPYPFAMIFPQDEHEALLIERLAAEGIVVERGAKLVSLEERGENVSCRLAREGSGDETIEARFVAGCDGARSTCRTMIRAHFPGGTYEHLFYVADVEARGPVMNHELHLLLDDAGFLGIFPLAGEGRARIIGTIRAASEGRTPTWEDVERAPIERIGLSIARVNWFSTYRVHHRVADVFRRGRVFLLGDAAHIHSPVGGQGMNTGLGDAMNLGWKLAAVLSRRAHDDLLDTYEPERIAFARRLVATTDRVFSAVSSESVLAESLRTSVFPTLVPRLASSKLGRRFFFRTLSQTGISYRTSTWSTGKKGSIRGGDRLPWVPSTHEGEDDNYAPLRSLDWQAHVYGAPIEELRARRNEIGIPLVERRFDERTRDAGLHEETIYLVRPDGYLGGVFEGRNAVNEMAEYVARHGILARNRG